VVLLPTTFICLITNDFGGRVKLNLRAPPFFGGTSSIFFPPTLISESSFKNPPLVFPILRYIVGALNEFQLIFCLLIGFPVETLCVGSASVGFLLIDLNPLEKIVLI